MSAGLRLKKNTRGQTKSIPNVQGLKEPGSCQWTLWEVSSATFGGSNKMRKPAPIELKKGRDDGPGSLNVFKLVRGRTQCEGPAEEPHQHWGCWCGQAEQAAHRQTKDTWWPEPHETQATLSQERTGLEEPNVPVEKGMSDSAHGAGGRT